MPTTVLDQQSRNGSFDTGSISIAPNATSITLDTAMLADDAANTGNQCRVGLRFSWDNGVIWDGSNAAWSYTWQGGLDKNGNARGPEMGLGPVPTDALGAPANRVMGFIDTLGFTLSIGVTLDAS